jgi:streptogramin lyase
MFRTSTIFLLIVGLALTSTTFAGSPITVPPNAIYLRNETSILQIDPATGNRTVVSSNSVGSGPSIILLPGTFPFPAEQSAIIVEDDLNLLITDRSDVLRVNRRTGDRTLLIDHTNIIGDIALEDSNNLLVFANSEIVRYQLDTPTTFTTLASGSVGSGESPFTAWGIEVQPTGGILWHTLSGQNIIRVDPITLNRTVFSGNTSGGPPLVGTGPTTFYWNLTIDQTSGRVYSTPKGTALWATETPSGDRSILSQDGTAGTGPAFTGIEGMGVAADGTIYVLDREAEAIFAVDPANGNRTIVSSMTLAIGTGPQLCNPLPSMFSDSTFFMDVAQDDGDGPLSVGNWSDY